MPQFGRLCPCAPDHPLCICTPPLSCADDHAVCLATTAWLHIAVGLIAPVLYNLWVWRPPPQRQPPPAGATRLDRLLQWLSRAVATCDLSLHSDIGGSAEQALPLCAVVVYYALAASWLLIRA